MCEYQGVSEFSGQIGIGCTAFIGRAQIVSAMHENVSSQAQVVGQGG